MFSVVWKTDAEIDGALGYTKVYDSSGKPISSDWELDEDWSYVQIQMNIDESAFIGASDPYRAAKKTFIHEIGHALKLKHPEYNSTLELHNWGGGYPLSVMNQGFPGAKGGATYETVRYHDEINLKAKWGG